MSVLCEAISVIVPRDVLERLWPGGVEAYAASIPNRTFCADGRLTRVGFMHPNDVGHHLNGLAAAGLTTADEHEVFVDLAVVDQFEGPTRPCAWLEWERVEQITRAWLSGSEPGELATPPGWKRTTLALWKPGPAGTIQTITDPGVDLPEESFMARAFEDE
jgi:hypothetical protein